MEWKTNKQVVCCCCCLASHLQEFFSLFFLLLLLSHTLDYRQEQHLLLFEKVCELLPHTQNDFISSTVGSQQQWEAKKRWQQNNSNSTAMNLRILKSVSAAAKKKLSQLWTESAWIIWLFCEMCNSSWAEFNSVCDRDILCVRKLHLETFRHNRFLSALNTHRRVPRVWQSSEFCLLS